MFVKSISTRIDFVDSGLIRNNVSIYVLFKKILSNRVSLIRFCRIELQTKIFVGSGLIWNILSNWVSFKNILTKKLCFEVFCKFKFLSKVARQIQILSKIFCRIKFHSQDLVHSNFFKIFLSNQFLLTNILSISTFSLNLIRV